MRRKLQLCVRLSPISRQSIQLGTHKTHYLLCNLHWFTMKVIILLNQYIFSSSLHIHQMYKTFIFNCYTHSIYTHYVYPHSIYTHACYGRLTLEITLHWITLLLSRSTSYPAIQSCIIYVLFCLVIPLFSVLFHLVLRFTICEDNSTPIICTFCYIQYL